MSVDNAPVVTPTPATIKPTSPLDIIPIPTLIDLALSLRNIQEGKPQPISFVDMSIATIIPAMTNTFRLIPRKSTWAPMIAKKRGAKMNCSLWTYSSICLISLVLATAIPTAKAPTIGDNPIYAAIPAVPKKIAVVIPSMLP